MTERQLWEQYFSFLSQHRKYIHKELGTAFSSFVSQCIGGDIRADILHNSDFGFFVGGPLLIVWVALVAALGFRLFSLGAVIVTVAILLFGFLLRYYAKHIATISCRYFFRKEKYCEVLIAYVEQCRSSELSQYLSEQDRNNTNEFFDYCREHIVLEDFRYYK